MPSSTRWVATVCCSAVIGALIQAHLISPSYQAGHFASLGLTPSNSSSRLAEAEQSAETLDIGEGQVVGTDSVEDSDSMVEPDSEAFVAQALALAQPTQPRKSEQSASDGQGELDSDRDKVLSYVPDMWRRGIQHGVDAVVSALAKQLNLYPDQKLLLEQYSEQKVALQLEMIGLSQMVQRGLLEPEESSSRHQELKEQWQQISEEYQQEMSSLLTSEQLERYQNYENTKAELAYGQAQLYFQQQLVSLMPELGSDRLQQVGERLEQVKPAQFDVPLGTDGFMTTDGNEYSFNINAALEQLRDVLTDEEVEAYQQRQAEQVKAMNEHFAESEEQEAG